MEQQELYEKVERILVDNFGVPEDQVSREATIQDLDLDSLDLVEMTMQVEEELGVEIEDEEVADVETIQDVVELLERKTGEGVSA